MPLFKRKRFDAAPIFNVGEDSLVIQAADASITDLVEVKAHDGTVVLTIDADGVIDAPNTTTDDITEGNINLYFTNQRALDATDQAYDPVGSASTAEQNANTYTDSEISALDTDDIEEGQSNLYFTDARGKGSVGADAGGVNSGIRFIAANEGDVQLISVEATRSVRVVSNNAAGGGKIEVKGSMGVVPSGSIADPGNLDVAGGINASSISIGGDPVATVDYVDTEIDALTT